MNLEAHFSWSDPAIGRLLSEVYEACILGKVFPPEEPLRQRWIGPGGIYNGQWIWDTMFVVDLLSILPDQDGLIREVFQNFWDFQAAWNSRMPDYAQGMVTCNIKPGMDNVACWPYAQIPILAWGLERVYARRGDTQLLAQCLAPLEAFHDWYWRERDVTGVGLVAVGAYNGKIRHARWEAFDDECNMDDMTMTAHPTRQGAGEGAWYGDICVAGNTAYLILAERCLQRLAEAQGDHAMAARRQTHIDKGVAAMRQHMWDPQAGIFRSVHRDSLVQIPAATIGGWIPLLAGVPTPDMAAHMVAALDTPAWHTPLRVPTVERTDPRWRSDAFWRGDVWPATNYQIATGLAAYGYPELAADIADTTIANALKNGISEYYDSVSGKALGVTHLGMTCTLITMMLDGLSARYDLTVRDPV